MIRTVIWISGSRLVRNRVELGLTFVVPIVFFSIFALIFGKGMSGSTSSIKSVIVDRVDSPTSREIKSQLEAHESLKIMPFESANGLTGDDAAQLVQRGLVTTAVVLNPEPQDAKEIRAELLIDASDRVASQLAAAIVNQVLMKARFKHPSVALANHIDQHDMYANAVPHPTTANTTANFEPSITEPTNQVFVVDVLGDSKSNPIVSMYAAGIAVMFLLFNATSGGGALMEEREATTLERLLTTQLTMDQLLLGKWCYQTLLGMLQITLMFLWGSCVFGMEFWPHMEGFAAMTFVTAAAASSFGLLLATVCKSRGQLNGLSVILILTMSALGGSMVPRYLMSDSIRSVGQLTFNAWALDGYNKIFWRDLSLGDIHIELGILLSASAIMLIAARFLAVRWEAN